jgi:hypothetical protein
MAIDRFVLKMQLRKALGMIKGLLQCASRQDLAKRRLNSVISTRPLQPRERSFRDWTYRPC